MKVLFVCSGNICRSPMAEVCLRYRASQMGIAGLVVDSAGTLGIEDSPASGEAVKVIEELGLDLTPHRSKGVALEHVETSDLVVGMAREHLVELTRRFPGWHGRRVLVRAFEHRPEPGDAAPDLEDPIGCSLRFYRKQLPLLLSCIDNLVTFIQREQAREEPAE